MKRRYFRLVRVLVLRNFMPEAPLIIQIGTASNGQVRAQIEVRTAPRRPLFSERMGWSKNHASQRRIGKWWVSIWINRTKEVT